MEKEREWNIKPIIINNKIELLHYDSYLWLKSLKPNSVKNFVTALPDFQEVIKFIPTIEEYIKWFYTIVKLIFRATCKKGYCIFQQTDRKLSTHLTKSGNQELLSKSYLIIKASKKKKMQLLWHKIGIYGEICDINTNRVGYSHILCFSKSNIGDIYNIFPDVIFAHTKMYNNSTATEIMNLIFEFLKKYMKRKYKNNKVLKYDIVDPFIGQGTSGLFAQKYGFSLLGIDISKYQVNKSKENILNITNFATMMNNKC